MNVFLPPHYHRRPEADYHEPAFWAGGQVPMMAPPPQPNQVIYPIFTTLPENRPRLTREQWQRLEDHYRQERKPSTATKRVIAQSMNVPLEKINNWFQNRRAKERQEDKKAKAAAAAQDDEPLAESADVPAASPDQQTLPSQPVSQPMGSTQLTSSLTPARLSTADMLPSHAQPLLPSPSEELDCVIQCSQPASLTEGEPVFDSVFVGPPVPGLYHNGPMPVISTESLSNSDVYPSPVQTVFSSPEQQFQVASQSVSASQSPEGLHPIMPHDFSQSIAAENLISSGPAIPQLAIVSNELPVPDIAYPHGEADGVLTSAVVHEDYAPFFNEFSGPTTPTYQIAHFNEQHPNISTQAASGAITTTAEFSTPSATFLGLPHDGMLNSSSVSLPAAFESQSLEQLMPPPDPTTLFKPRQSSQPNLAARRRKNAPGAIQIGPVGSMGRSGSYTAGMPHPLSPRSPHLAAADQALRRIKSSNNTAGRIQKPMTPSQRSPFVFPFGQNAHLLDNQTPPPSATNVETPTVSMIEMPPVSNVAFANAQPMFPSEMNFNVPWSAPPTQQTFMLHTDGGPFPTPGVLPSTPSPTSQPQHLPS